ncbi:MAG: hypothetical protein WDA18_08015 [Candidatus Ratteibacteria bacterium]|jgi:ribosomal protein L15
MPRGDGTGPMGGGRGQGRGLGRMGGRFAAGTGGFCVCPKCGKKVPHERAMPCASRKCDACGSMMLREQ